uniref:Uncharacterized protein n=1 Tax=Anguilla anguilla TaxID=7936 RepID=A0A0E9S8M6_ANGAN
MKWVKQITAEVKVDKINRIFIYSPIHVCFLLYACF